MELFSKPLSVAVIGGGISGMTVAIEAAESGAEVLLIERSPQLGGNVSRFFQYFPKLHSTESSMEMHFRRIETNSRIRVLTNTEATGIRGEKGNFTVDLLVKPRHVKENCTLCGKCAEVCPVEIEDHFNFSMRTTKAAYLPDPKGYPGHYVIDNEACRKTECGKCVDVCADGAIDFSEQSRAVSVKAANVVMATGWEPYDATLLESLGLGRIPNIISNVMMERMFAPSGPTGGKLVRPSDGREVKNIAFVQCAGQRDEDHLPYCSNICCLVSMKQAYYVTRHYPDSAVNIVYTELYNPNPARYGDFISRISGEQRLNFMRGKVEEILEARSGGGLILRVRDVQSGNVREIAAEMAVLAVGMVPSATHKGFENAVVQDAHGFIDPDRQKDGIYVTGSARVPGDVTTSMCDAAQTALRTLQNIRQ